MKNTHKCSLCGEIVTIENSDRIMLSGVDLTLCDKCVQKLIDKIKI